MSTLRTVSAKFVLVVLAMLAAIFITESLILSVVGRINWELSGPGPACQQMLKVWQIIYGHAPPEQNSMVLAPVMPPPDTPTDWYRVDEAAPAEWIHAPNGLITYGFARGPRIPCYLPTLPDFLRGRNYQPGSLPRVVHGTAWVSTDGELWCGFAVAMPYRYRTREYVGTVDDFPPSPSAKGWRRWHYDPKMLAHNLAVWLLLFGWLFYLREIRAPFAFYRRRAWMRQGRCGSCGYDVRQLKGQRCPECGLTLPKKASTKA